MTARLNLSKVLESAWQMVRVYLVVISPDLFSHLAIAAGDQAPTVSYSEDFELERMTSWLMNRSKECFPIHLSLEIAA